MAFWGTLTEKMYFLVLKEDKRISGIFVKDSQVPIFADEPAAKLMMKQRNLKPPWALISTPSWDVLYMLLTNAQKGGADSIAFIGTNIQPKAAAIDQVVEAVREVVTGKHDGNPECSN